MRKCLLAIAMFLCTALWLGDAFAYIVNKRVALVIGNGNYQHAVTLPNPVNDGKLIADTLRKAGFTVIEGTDLDKVGMGKALDQFTEAAYDADVAVVYYAGHGLQVDGHNYLIPIDAELEKPAQLQTRTIPVEDVLAALPPDPAVGVIILDACRDNPLARTLAAALPKSRSMGAGLAPVQANGLSHDAGGLLIAYATDPGAVAYDGSTEHSPYTTALAKHLTTPGLEIQSALTRVRADVSEATNGAQRPWHNASLAREVYIGGQAQAPQATAKQVPAAGQAAAAAADASPPAGSDVDWTVEQKLWDEASKRNTVAHYELYLDQYPQGRFADVAKLNIDQIKEAEATGAAAPAKPEQVAINMTPGSQSRTAVGVSDELKQAPGTAETEAALKLDRDGRIDLQLRLNALGYDTGGFDGSLGARSRTAIGSWQKQNNIIQTGYLTPEQHMVLVVQSDPMMADVRARYEAEKAAWAARPKTAAAKPAAKTAAKTTTVKKQQVATKTATRRKPTQTADDNIPYRPRGTGQGQPVDNSAGSFAAGALLGTGLGLVIGNNH